MPPHRADDALLPQLRGRAAGGAAVEPPGEGRMTAMQQRAFCGNCGAPLAPGATFCGRCGTPVAAPVQVAAAPAAYPAYPAYAYPRAQPAPGRIGRDHTTQIAVAMGLVFLLILGAVIVSLVALSNNPGSHPVCTQNCGPKIGTALPEQATYTSAEFGCQVD